MLEPTIRARARRSAAVDEIARHARIGKRRLGSAQAREPVVTVVEPRAEPTIDTLGSSHLGNSAFDAKVGGERLRRLGVLVDALGTALEPAHFKPGRAVVGFGCSRRRPRG